MRRRTGLAVLVVLVAVPCLGRPAAATTAIAGAATDAAGGAGPPAPVAYRPPVDATPLVDTFRPPASTYGAGNRGVDYATAPGQPVHAAADGEVTFAGRIGATSHVVLLHADGLRTSYSFLATADVRRGRRVQAGEPIGTAGAAPPFHFGVRAGEAYLDPLVLLGQRPAGDGDHPRLVADPDEHRPLAEAAERRRLLDSLRRHAAAGAAWLHDRAADAVARKVALLEALRDSAADLGVPLPVHLAVAALRWEEAQATCTPVGTPRPAPPRDDPATPRVVLLVGGLGSSTGDSAVLDVDTAALGYDAAHVHQFTYRADPTQPYRPEDTLGDIAVAGARLAEQVAELQRRHPGSAVDVVAHSQGGLVARSAITVHGAAPTTVVTLGTPHQGADLATAGVALRGTVSGHLLLAGAGRAAGALTGTGIDPLATSVAQMSESGDFLRDLPERGWPAATHVVSVGGRGDPVVPSHQTRLAGASHAVVSPHGHGRIDDHERLPGSPEATTEIARALARQAPTCRTLVDALVDEAVGRAHANHQDLTGVALAVGGLYVDARARTAGLDALRR